MAQTYNALIVDDERIARANLINKLKHFEEIKVVAEADNIDCAIKKIQEYLPDVIFLDIQLTNELGFELLNKIDFNGKVIFVTAYDEYAIKAFELNALDYLLKPVNLERLKGSIARLNQAKPKKRTNLRKLDNSDKLFLSIGNTQRFLDISTIIYIKADGDYTFIKTTGEINGLALKTMNEWESRLPEQAFCRIHRSTIVNINKIDKIQRWFNSTNRVFLKGIKEPFIMSRYYKSKVKALFG